MEERHEYPRAAGADRVAERDRAAVGVDPLGVDAQLLDHGERLGRERLVELEEVDVSQLKPGLLERAAHAGTGPMPMILGSTPTDAWLSTVPNDSRPRSRALRADMTTIAAAPSLT